MVGWHHPLKRHESEQNQGDCEGQRSLACGSTWSLRKSDTNEQLNHHKKLPEEEGSIPDLSAQALTSTPNSSMGVHDSSVGKESTCNAGDLGSIPGLGRSPGEGKGYPLQYSGLENSMDCIVHGAGNSWRRLSDFH